MLGQFYRKEAICGRGAMAQAAPRATPDQQASKCKPMHAHHPPTQPTLNMRGRRDRNFSSVSASGAWREGGGEKGAAAEIISPHAVSGPTLLSNPHPA